MDRSQICITGQEISAKCKNSLESFGYNIIELPPFHALGEPVAAHPDMLLGFVADRMHVHSGYYKIAQQEIESIMSLSDRLNDLCICDDVISNRYPNDILMNFFICGEYLIGKTDSIAESAKQYALSCGLKLLNVRQGYAKCSSCLFEDSVITADEGIYNSLKDKKINALRISSGSVKLKDFDYGFIGGASGYDAKARTLFFCGNITRHTDWAAISEFCFKAEINVVSLSDEPLYDYGTLFFIE